MKKSGKKVEVRDGEIPSTECSAFAALTFGELKVGDMFISLPLPGDNSGHGGFQNTYHIFIKTAKFIGHRENAVRFKDGIYSSMPDSMRVIKIE